MALRSDFLKGMGIDITQSDLISDSGGIAGQGMDADKNPRLDLIEELIGGFEGERDAVAAALEGIQDPAAAAEEAKAEATGEFDKDRPALNKKQVALQAIANALAAGSSRDPGVAAARLIQQVSQNRTERIEARREAGEEAAARAESRVLREQEKLEKKRDRIEDIIRQTEVMETQEGIRQLDKEQTRREKLEDRKANETFAFRMENYKHWIEMNEKRYDNMNRAERDELNFQRQKELEDIRHGNSITEGAIRDGRITARQLQNQYVGLGLDPDTSLAAAQFRIRNPGKELPNDLQRQVDQAQAGDISDPRFRNAVRNNILTGWRRDLGNKWEQVPDDEGNMQWVKLSAEQEIDQLFGMLQGWDRKIQNPTGARDEAPGSTTKIENANLETALGHVRSLWQQKRMAESPQAVAQIDAAMQRLEKKIMESTLPSTVKEEFMKKSAIIGQSMQSDIVGEGVENEETEGSFLRDVGSRLFEASPLGSLKRGLQAVF